MQGRDPKREFDKAVRSTERISAKSSCRMCGISKDRECLQYAHIYTLSKNKNWRRAGGSDTKWYNDDHVSSSENCVLLCKTHHGKIDSPLGLQKVTVPYLESLKVDSNTCTALITSKNGEWRRCKNKTSNYRCHLHKLGGLEESLQARAGWGNSAKKPDQQSVCIIL